MSRTLQVGIVGASAENGWARGSHVPAVKALAGLELGAVATQSQTSADKAAKAFGARIGYGDPAALFADPKIDIVTVAVKVPDHHQLVMGALRAGKHVYCEWPLSPTLKEAEALAVAAEDAKVKVAIGLQSRFNPAVKRAAELLAAAAIGRVLGARCYSTCGPWGSKIPEAAAAYETPDAGMNLITIQAAHSLDLLVALTGRFANASALATRQYPEVAVGEDGRRLRRETYDHLIAAGALEAGGTFQAEIAGGRPQDRTPFELAVVGETGDLSLTGGGVRGFQAGRLTLTLNGEPQDVDDGERAGFSDEALNVGGVYAQLRDDITNGTRLSPDFGHAVRLTRLMADLLAASAERRSREEADWPR